MPEAGSRSVPGDEDETVGFVPVAGEPAKSCSSEVSPSKTETVSVSSSDNLRVRSSRSPPWPFEVVRHRRRSAVAPFRCRPGSTQVPIEAATRGSLTDAPLPRALHPARPTGTLRSWSGLTGRHHRHRRQQRHWPRHYRSTARRRRNGDDLCPQRCRLDVAAQGLSALGTVHHRVTDMAVEGDRRRSSSGRLERKAELDVLSRTCRPWPGLTGFSRSSDVDLVRERTDPSGTRAWMTTRAPTSSASAPERRGTSAPRISAYAVKATTVGSQVTGARSGARRGSEPTSCRLVTSSSRAASGTGPAPMVASSGRQRSSGNPFPPPLSTEIMTSSRSS
jgi:hypothetical protein